MNKILSSKARVRFQDCDPYNHLNNAKYIDYMINAREDQVLDNYNLDVFSMAKTEGRAWVVATNQIAYLNPAFTMENIVIESSLIQYGAKGLQVEIRMWSENRTELKAFMWVNFVHYDFKTKAVVAHKDALMALFAEVHSPVAELIFEDRVKALKKMPTQPV